MRHPHRSLQGLVVDETGFSLIEALLASVLLLFIALGVLPMFTNATQSNLQGQDSTGVANVARLRIEEFVQLDFNDPELTLTAGTQKIDCEWYSIKDDAWTDFDCADLSTPPAGADYTLRLTVEQYQMSELSVAMANGDPYPALDFLADPTRVQIKQVIAEVTSQRAGLLGPGKSLSVRVFKSV